MPEKICKICSKKSSMNVTLVKLRGKYNPTSKIRKYPNLQWARLPSGERIVNRKTVALICASLIVACLACHGGSLNAQNYGGGSYYGSTYGGNVDVGTGGMSIPPADVMARSFSNGYGYGACSNPCYSSC